MRFPISSAQQNALDAKPAIVQAAKKDWQYYESLILASEECTGRLYKEYKEGGAWREQYKTWTDACVPLGKPRRTVDSIIARDEFIRQELPNVDHKKESAALKQVERAREDHVDKYIEIPPKEEDEKPAVHSADEVKRDQPKPHNNGQNGKPKYQLALWGELETYCGKSLNRADELNRQCPNPRLHSQFIQHGNICMNILETWKKETK